MTGLEQIHSILSRLLISLGDVVLVEEFSYFLPNMIFNQAGAQMKTVPVDSEGMDIDFIKNNFKPGEIRFLYISTQNANIPQQQSFQRIEKYNYLELAEDYNFIVIENDTDFEFHL